MHGCLVVNVTNLVQGQVVVFPCHLATLNERREEEVKKTKGRLISIKLKVCGNRYYWYYWFSLVRAVSAWKAPGARNVPLACDTTRKKTYLAVRYRIRDGITGAEQ